jgi:hypothetical protein
MSTFIIAFFIGYPLKVHMLLHKLDVSAPEQLFVDWRHSVQELLDRVCYKVHSPTPSGYLAE